MKNIPYGRQSIDDEDIKAVVNSLRSDLITQGPKIAEFEEKLAEYCGARYAVVFNSGTAALHSAYFSLGLTQSDEFITTPTTFVATSNAGLYLGAIPKFVDIEPDTGNIDIDAVESQIANTTKLISVVHFAGHSVNMKPLQVLAKKYGLFVVEDASHALGGKYKHFKVGSCKFSDATIFSFHPVKHITTGEGGAVLTNSKQIYRKLLLFRSHGVTKNPREFKLSQAGSWYYEMHELGFNYRMPDILAALGISQLKKIDNFILQRRAIADQYTLAFRNNPYFKLPTERAYASHAFHLYPIFLKKKFLKHKHTIVADLHSKNIGVQVHYIPVHTHPLYRKLLGKINLPASVEFYKSEISLPIFPGLSKENISYIVTTLEQILKRYDV